MKIYLKFFLTVIFMYANYSNSQVVSYANDFLNLGGFSSSQSLSNSDFSLVEGAKSGFVNPSRLHSADCGWDFAIMHSGYLGGLASHDVAAASCNVDSLMSLSATLLRVGIDDIQNTIHLYGAGGVPDYSNITYFSVADYAAFFSVGRLVPRVPGLSVGLSAKLIYRQEGSFAHAFGFGVDISASLRRGRWAASLILNDATTTFDFWNVDCQEFDSVFVASGNSVPESRMDQTSPSIVSSAAWGRAFSNFRLDITSALKCRLGTKTHDILHSKFISASPAFGAQLSYMGVVSLRAGVSDFQYDRLAAMSRRLSVSPSFGAGVCFCGFSLDYAFSAIGAVGLHSNVFTLGYCLR